MPKENQTTKVQGQEEEFVIVHSTRNSEKTNTVVKEREVRVIREEIQLEDEDEDDDQNGDEVEGDMDDLLASLPDDTEEIDLIHARLNTLTNLRLPRFAKHLKRLCLRQNFLKKLEGESFTPLLHLEDLDLYDNQIKHIGNALEKLPLRVLDLSFNLLRSVPDILPSITSLDTVYFVQNKITTIDNLNNLKNLRSLELGGNRIRNIENLGELVNLEELWLGKNKIVKLENLESLKKLKILSIQSNRIVKLEGLDQLPNLKEIYLSHNGIERIEGLENSTELTVLDITGNKISKLENISHLRNLTEFWASDNQIPTLQYLDKELGGIACLETIYLEGNPCQKQDMANYRRKVMLALPQVNQIDATYVKQQ